MEVIFDTILGNFIITDAYMEVSSELHTDNRVFGWGERRAGFTLKNGNYTIWTKDSLEVDEGTPGK